MLAILTLALCLGADLALASRNLTDKTVLITGAARGNGYAIADKFLENGVKLIIIVDKNETSGPVAAETLGAKYGEDKVVFIKGDVRTDLDEIYDSVLENYGCLDILVNNAGVMDEPDSEGMLKTNTIALVSWSLKFRELMRVDQTSQCGNGGLILNIASLGGHIELPFLSSYLASKFAVVGFTRSLGHKYNEKQTGVSVVGLCPGYTYTTMTENMIVEDYQKEDYEKFYNSQDWQQPEAVGSGAVDLYENAESGTIWDVIGGEAPYTAPYLTVVTLEDIESL